MIDITHLPSSPGIPEFDLLNRIRFLSYNIRVDHEQDSNNENKWSHRIHKAIFTIKQYKSDIIALQEPNMQQLNDIEKAFRPDFVWVFCKANNRAYEDLHAFKSEQHRETQAIGFNRNRFQLINSGHFWLAEDPSKEPTTPAFDGSLFARVAVYAILEEIKSRKQFIVMTTHFDHQGLQARIFSARLVVKKAIELSKNCPFIISGDFNTFQNDAGPLVYDAFKEQFDMVSDVRDIAAKSYGPISTWVGWEYNGFNEKEMEKKMPGIPSRWDHIFVSKSGINVEMTAVCDDRFEIKWNDELKIVYPSDHRPMLMDFTL